MKQLLFILVTAVLFSACNNNKTASESTEEKKVETTSADVNYAYKASYSSDMKVGEASTTKLVLDFIKGWEDGTMTGWKDQLADSVWINFADGQRFWLSRDSVIAMGSQYRAMYSSVKLDAQGFLPIHVNDKNEDYLLFWDKEITTDKKSGKVDSLESHSFWQVKNNKIAGWQDYNRKLVAPMTNK